MAVEAPVAVAFRCAGAGRCPPPRNLCICSFGAKAVVTQVTNGKNAMSAFGGRLSDDDIANVATYISEACLRSIQALFVTY